MTVSPTARSVATTIAKTVGMCFSIPSGLCVGPEVRPPQPDCGRGDNVSGLPTSCTILS